MPAIRLGLSGEKLSSSSTMFSFHGKESFSVANMIWPAYWWNALRPYIVRTMEAVKEGSPIVLVGATALAAEYQGTANASHIREKLAEMIHLAETIYSGSVACSAMGYKTPSGAYYPDPLLANTTKHNVTRHIYEISRLAHDIAGGIVATTPFQGDLESSEVGRYVQKYLAGAEGIPVEDRIKILRLIENMSGGTALVESMHGAGSPQTQKVMYGRLGNLEQKKRWAKGIVGIK